MSLDWSILFMLFAIFLQFELRTPSVQERLLGLSEQSRRVVRRYPLIMALSAVASAFAHLAYKAGEKWLW